MRRRPFSGLQRVSILLLAFSAHAETTNGCPTQQFQCSLQVAGETLVKSAPVLELMDQPVPPPTSVCDYHVEFSKEETRASFAMFADSNLDRKLRMYAMERGNLLQPTFSLTTVPDQKVSLTIGETVMTCWSHDVPPPEKTSWFR